MRLSFAPYLAAAALPLTLGLATPSTAATVVYCQYIGVPKGCVARAGVVLRPAPAAVVRAPSVGAPGVNTPLNRGGPVNRVGRR